MDDKSDDVMVYFDGSEEEESGNEESKSEQKIEFLKENLREFCLISIKSTIFMDDHICMYCSVFRQIYSPPPETIV